MLWLKTSVQSIHSSVKNKCHCPWTVDFWNVNFTNNDSYTEEVQFSKPWNRKWLVPVAQMVKAIGMNPKVGGPTWWRNQMETFSALLDLCEGNPPVTGGFLHKRPVTRSFEVFLDLRLNKRLNKQSRGRWFETSSRSLWRHCNESSWGDTFSVPKAPIVSLKHQFVSRKLQPVDR